MDEHTVASARAPAIQMASGMDMLRRRSQIDDDEVRWWTFAGGRVNTTLEYALEAITSWKVVPDNFVVRLRGDGDRARELDEAMARISEPAFWDDEGLWRRIAGSLPDYRLSKFQDVFPPAAASEMLASFLLDTIRARAVASRVGAS